MIQEARNVTFRDFSMIQLGDDLGAFCSYFLTHEVIQVLFWKFAMYFYIEIWHLTLTDAEVLVEQKSAKN
jgi:hypothetical protein